MIRGSGVEILSKLGKGGGGYLCNFKTLRALPEQKKRVVHKSMAPAQYIIVIGAYGMRAMIVDDEAPARSELKYLLEESGRVDPDSWKQRAHVKAVEKLMEVRVDVMFLDISMPRPMVRTLAEALHKLKNPAAGCFCDGV